MPQAISIAKITIDNECQQRAMMVDDVVEIDCDQPEAAMRVLRTTGDTLLAVRDLSFYGAQIHVVVPNSAAAEATIKRLLTDVGIVVHSIRRIEPSLEDVFIAKLGRSGDDRRSVSPSPSANGRSE